MRSARIRLACLWLSQTARVLADNCLRLFAVLQVARLVTGAVDIAAFHLVTACFITPFIVLAPINGALSNALPRRWVLVGAAAFSLGIAALFAALDGSWLLAIALVGVGAAVYSPTRYALLPAAADDTHLPLTRITSWIEMGAAVGIVAGMLLALTLDGSAWLGLPAPVGVALVTGAVSLLAALPVRFAADVRRPELAGAAIVGFFRDCRRIGRDPETRALLLGLAGFLALVTAGAGAVMAYLEVGAADGSQTLMRAMLMVIVGAALGAALAGIPWHPTRSRGLVPPAATALLVVLAWAAGSTSLDSPCLMLGILGGLINVPLRAAYQDAVPADARGNGMAVLNTANHVFSTLLALLLVALVRLGIVTSGAGQLWFLALPATLGALVAWWALGRDTFELALEVLFWPIHRVHGYGPGLDKFPRHGPLLVYANHTAYFDPAWLAKVLPRRLTPMMTSDFYDLPGMNWLMKHVFHAIRVEASSFRREAPELEVAIQALDRGKCLLLFPEGWMRRRPEATVRQFGQGIWHILSQRPDTPIVPCWIEGGWGSYTSYCGGRPTVNKRMHWWWRLDVAVGEPQQLPTEVLADQRTTRTYLMQLCLDARMYLGLEAGVLPNVLADEEAAKAD